MGCPLGLDHNPLSLGYDKNTHAQAREMEPHTVMAMDVVSINTHCHCCAAMEQPHIRDLQSNLFLKLHTHPHRATSEAVFPPTFIYLFFTPIFRIKKQNRTLWFLSLCQPIYNFSIYSFVCSDVIEQKPSLNNKQLSLRLVRCKNAAHFLNQRRVMPFTFI